VTVAIAGFEEDQFTVVGAPLTAVTVAVSWVVAPTTTVAGEGATATAVTLGVLSGPGPLEPPPPHAAIASRRATVLETRGIIVTDR
jgi:hypothetical protein